MAVSPAPASLTKSSGVAGFMLQADMLQFAIFHQSLLKSAMIRRLKTLAEPGTTPHMLDAKEAAKKMAAAFYELTLAKADASTNPVERFKAAQRRVTLLARIFLPLRDNAEFKAAYAREVAALRGQATCGGNNVSAESGQQARLSSSPH
jgi:hypothetical protein